VLKPLRSNQQEKVIIGSFGYDKRAWLIKLSMMIF